MITTVGIVARLRLYQELLAACIGNCPGYAVVGVSSGEDERLGNLIALFPDVLIVDASVVESWRVAETAHEVRVGVLLLGPPDTQELAERAAPVERDVLLPPSSTVVELFRALARMRSQSLGRNGLPVEQTVPSVLTKRELEIFELMTQGMTNKSIAVELTLSLSTVKTHVHHILQKVGAAGRWEVAVSPLRGHLDSSAHRQAADPGRSAPTP